MRARDHAEWRSSSMGGPRSAPREEGAQVGRVYVRRGVCNRSLRCNVDGGLERLLDAGCHHRTRRTCRWLLDHLPHRQVARALLRHATDPARQVCDRGGASPHRGHYTCASFSRSDCSWSSISSTSWLNTSIVGALPLAVPGREFGMPARFDTTIPATARDSEACAQRMIQR